MSKTIREVLASTTLYFQRHEIAAPRLTIELLLADLLKKTRLQLYLEVDTPVTEAQLDRLRPMVKRRSEGEPLEYLLGVTTFAGHPIEVSPAVLIPRPETEILLQATLPLITTPGLSVADIGTGSGILAVALARQFPEIAINAVDISAEALGIAQGNGAGLRNLNFTLGDLLNAPGLPEHFQLIVANLPYIPTAHLATLPREVRHEPRIALDGGADGLDLIRRLVAQSRGRTRHLALELGDDQAGAVKTLCQNAGYALIRVLPDFTGRDRVLLAEHHG